MKTQLIVSGAKVFNVKEFGSFRSFAIKINSKNKDGSYTNGNFLNCKTKEDVQTGAIYTLEGFLIDNEYNDKNTLNFFVMSAIREDVTSTPKAKVLKEVIKKIDEIEIDNNDTIPF